METLSFDGKEIPFDRVKLIGGEVEEKKMLWLIPATRIIGIVVYVDDQGTHTLSGYFDGVAEWVSVVNLEMDIAGFKGKRVEFKSGMFGFSYDETQIWFE